jgi:hypothetical protein
MKTKQPFAIEQTPAQRKAYAAQLRREDAGSRMRNDIFGFWRVCEQPLCRRNHSCSGDMHACFQRLWPLVPEEQKEYLRACIMAAKDTRSKEAIHRAGIAARDACLKRQKEIEAASAAQQQAQPARAVPGDPEVRVRRL